MKMRLDKITRKNVPETSPAQLTRARSSKIETNVRGMSAVKKNTNSTINFPKSRGLIPK